MKRDYSTGVDESITFFTGIEVEHTPAYGKKTLFVVGIQPTALIQDWYDSHNCEHIYFGANQSFPNLKTNDGAEWAKWETMIFTFLERDILCTLDTDVSCAQGILESGLCENHNFIPQLSVKLPYLQQLGYNATIKIDDIDFNATNPGVWCVMLNELTKRSSFTDWSQYKKDEIIK
jgi:hypothetical protein